MKIQFESAHVPAGTYEVVVGRYHNGVNAIWIENKTGEQELCASVNPPEGSMFDPHLCRNFVAVKNWSENEGVAEGLKRAGIIGGEHEHEFG